VLTIFSMAVAVVAVDSVNAEAEAANPKYAGIVVDARTGNVLYSENADRLQYPASLTKMMTLYMTFEALEQGRIRLDTPVPFSAHAAAQAPTKLGVRAGSTITVEQGILGLVTLSANDAATALGEMLGGSEDRFAQMMTAKAHALGMTRTTYRNANGLPNDEQVTTARDQALLGIAIQQRFPKYYRYFSLANFVYRGQNMRNHNHLLGRVEGVDGIKTGYINASGFNIVTSVKRGYRHIVAVVMGGRSAGSRDARMRELIEENIADASNKPAMIAGEQPPSPQPVAKQDTKLQPKPEAKPEVAASDAESAPVLAQPAPETTTAAIPGANDAPIKPVKVKTFAVKLVPSKGAHALTNAPATAPAAAETAPDPATTRSVRTAFAATTPPEADVPALAAMPAPLKAPDTVVAPVSSRAAPLGKLQTASIKPEDVAVSSVPTKPATTRGGWAIQIGAYEDEGEAKGKLTTAKGRISSLFHKAEAYIERTVKGAKTYYRARFAGFDRDQAQATCKKLKRDDIACMALKL
jgi:D-alanyl-D-alanine carboxypeptidase